MHKTNIFFIVGLVALLVLTGCSSNNPEPTTENLVQAKPQIFETKSTGSTGMGDVLVELTSHRVTNGQLEVDIAVNTHSVNLAQFDLKEITTLEFNEQTQKPISAPTLAGHHASGTLIFETGEYIDSFTIKIEGIPKIEERIFAWRKEE
jgi:hypothetical protein